ncbi:MAG: PhoH family protein [Candidatus Babeliales bacterium]
MAVNKPSKPLLELPKSQGPKAKPPTTSTPSKPSTGQFRPERIFVLDTNVLIHDAHAISSFKNVVVGIPFIVLEELDTLKREVGERGRNAREAVRVLDDLRSKGSLSEGVKLNHGPDGALVKILPSPRTIDFSSVSSDVHDIKDNSIIQTVKNLVKDGANVTLVSKDINARVKADALGLPAEDYTKGTVSYEHFYQGWMRIAIPALDLKTMTPKKLESVIGDQQLWPNQFIILESDNNPHNNRLFRFYGNKNFQEVADISIMNSFGAKNIQQLMALDLLMDDSIQIMTLLGPAGTGKTFLTLLAGLYKVAYERIYRKLLVTRPIIALGADIGYLPGDIQEKLHYWMQPIHDNLEFIFSQLSRSNEEEFNLSKRKEKENKFGKKHFNQQQEKPGEMHSVERLQQKGIISLEAITYMRGRSIPYQFVFIDEVQNLTPHEVKTIVSRAGEGTKVILAGDPYQIDSPYLDFSSNGLTTATEKFKGHSIFGTVFLETSERSELAKLAAEIL